MLPEYKNEAFTDFTDPDNVKRMEEALAKVKSEFGQLHPLIIGDQKIDQTANGTLESINPSNAKQVVGRFPNAGVDHANRAVETAWETFQTWRKTDPETRARYLFRAAAAMRRRRFELAAWLVYEVSKSWVEADVDIAELIDFAEYYGRQMLRLSGPQEVVPFPGEDNELRYIPLGVGIVIPPWNFPGAIMGGMTMAALVAGNTVVLKPASTSPTIAAKFVQLLMEDCALPPGVVNFITGPGSTLGDAMVDHPKTRFIAFTGSKEVGIRIN